MPREDVKKREKGPETAGFLSTEQQGPRGNLGEESAGLNWNRLWDRRRGRHLNGPPSLFGPCVSVRLAVAGDFPGLYSAVGPSRLPVTK